MVVVNSTSSSECHSECCSTQQREAHNNSYRNLSIALKTGTPVKSEAFYKICSNYKSRIYICRRVITTGEQQDGLSFFCLFVKPGAVPGFYFVNNGAQGRISIKTRGGSSPLCLNPHPSLCPRVEGYSSARPSVGVQPRPHPRVPICSCFPLKLRPGGLQSAGPLVPTLAGKSTGDTFVSPARDLNAGAGNKQPALPPPGEAVVGSMNGLGVLSLT